jgi:DNA primase
MARIPDHLLNEIRTRVDVVGIVSREVSLKPKGRDYWGCCPFHGEKTASFKVSKDTGLIKCFGCGWSGSVFKFIMERQGLSFMETVRQLADETGVHLPEETTRGPRVARAVTAGGARTTIGVGGAGSNPGVTAEIPRELLFRANDWAGKWYAAQFEQSEVAKAYWLKRGYTLEQAREWGVGWGGDGWDDLPAAVHATAHSHPSGREGAQKLEKALAVVGVLATGKTGLYHRFAQRLMFAIRGTDLRIVGFGGRIIEDKEGAAKYMNSPESPAYHKGSVLFGLDRARDVMRKAGRAILCEGYFDVLGLWRAGFGEAVAPCGTALTEGQAKRLKGFAGQVLLVLDGDAAGQNATLKAAPVLLSQELDVRVLVLPPEHDPDSFVADYGPQAFAELALHARPVLEHIFDTLWQRHPPQTVEDRVALLRQFAPAYLWLPTTSIRANVVRDEYLSRIAERLGVSVSAATSVLREAARDADRFARYADDERAQADSDGDERGGLPAATVSGVGAEIVPVPANDARADLFALVCLADLRRVAAITDEFFEELSPVWLRDTIERIVHDARNGVRLTPDLYLDQLGQHLAELEARPDECCDPLAAAVEAWNQGQAQFGSSLATALDHTQMALQGPALDEQRRQLLEELAEASRRGDDARKSRLALELAETQQAIARLRAPMAARGRAASETVAVASSTARTAARGAPSGARGGGF